VRRAIGLIRRQPDPTDGRCTLAILTEAGWAVVDAAPGHVEQVRRLILDPLTKAQVKQMATIGKRIMHAIDPSDDYLKRL
jgi:DNA-binding MarR family transcriptional regulator